VLPPVYPLLLAPATWLIGPVATYNIALLATCVWAAYGTYLLVQALGGNFWGSVLAGIIFAFAPQREVYFAGHLNTLLGSMWLPWIVYGVIQAARLPSQRTRWVVLAFTAYALSICGAWQFALIGGVTFALSMFVSWLSKLRREGRVWLKPLTVGMLSFLVVAGPVLMSGLRARAEIVNGAEFSFQDVDGTSTSVERLIVPSGVNPLVWDLARKTFPLTGQDSVVAIGYMPLILAFYFVKKGRRSGPTRVLGLALMLLGTILTVGTTLHFWNKPVLLTLPGPSAEQARSFLESIGLPFLIDGQSLRIPLPSLILYWLLPFTRSFHHFGRWAVLTSLGAALLAGQGLTRLLLNRPFQKRLFVSALLILILIAEFNTQPIPTLTTMQQMHRAVNDWLAAQPDRAIIIEYPAKHNWNGQALYYTIAHGQKIVHGSSILSQNVTEMKTTLSQWPEPPALDLLQQIGVKYVLVDSYMNDNFETTQLPQLLSIPRLKLIQVFPTNVGPVRDVYLFELAKTS
jgi:hypothetical protein